MSNRQIYNFNSNICKGTEQINDITSYSPLNMVIKLQYKIQHDMAVPEKLNINSIGLMKLNIQIFLYLKLLRSH